MTKLEKFYSIIEKSREGGSEAKQGCSSASRELEPTVQGCIWRHESDGWYIFEYR